MISRRDRGKKKTYLSSSSINCNEMEINGVKEFVYVKSEIVSTVEE